MTQAMIWLFAYIPAPPWAKWLHIVLLTASYILMGVAGFAALTLDHPATEGGIALIAGAAVSILGVVLRIGQIEAIGLWPQVTGLVPVVIWLQIPPQNAVLSGWLVAAYIIFLGLRLLQLNIIAREARRAATTGDTT